MVFAAASIYSMLRNNELPETLFPSEEVHVTGTVIGVPETSYGKLRITIKDVAVEGSRISGLVKLVFLQDFGIKSSKRFMLSPGDRISAISKIKKPQSFRNPGVYSSGSGKDGVTAIGYVKRINVYGKEKGLMTWIHKKRQRLAWIMDNSLSEESASLHKAIVPGLKRGVGQEMRDGFSSTGLAHLLSISGTHFGLLGFIIFTLIKGLVKRVPSNMLVKMTVIITPTQIAVLITMPVLILYAFISGVSLPTIRSLVMVIIYMMALFLGRKDQWLNSLSIAAIIILLWQPGALFELSFQLSFAAVLSIGFVMEYMVNHEKQKLAMNFVLKTHEGKSFFKKMGKKIGITLLITIAAVIGTAPFVVMYFNRFPLISPLTNLVITPLICFVVLPLGFFTGFTALLFDLPLMPLSGLTDWLTLISLNLVKGFSQIPYATVFVHSPTIAEIILFYFGLLFVFINKKNVIRRCIPVFLVFIFYLLRPQFSSDNFSVTFLDVGQGESSVVQLPGREIMLIDGGTQKPDMGGRVIAPYLLSKGITSIDFLVLSHYHPDHYGGLRYIMDNFDIREIWSNGFFMNNKKSFLYDSENRQLMHRVMRRRDMLETDKYIVTVLHPYQSFHADSPRGLFSDENSSSLVFKVEAENISILFTGDIEEEAEENLLFAYEWLKSDIIKVPHHGGRTSSSMDFINAVRPKLAVVSSGRNNPFHHPHITTMYRYKNAGVEVFRTDRDGAVTVNIKNGRYEMSTYEDSKLLPVKHWQDELRNVTLLF
jgi:competence protein ComEC